MGGTVIDPEYISLCANATFESGSNAENQAAALPRF